MIKLSALSGARVGLLVWLAICLLVAAATGSLSVSLMQVWAVNVTPIFLLSVAAAMVISCGHVDISTGGIMSVVGMIVLFVFGVPNEGLGSFALAHFVAFIFILIVYWLYASAAIKGVSTLIVTLSAFLAAKGFATLLQTCMQGVGEVCRNSWNKASGASVIPRDLLLSPLGSPLFSVVILLLCLLALVFWRYRTRWGLEHIAVGIDKEAAKFARISSARIYALAFGAAGLLVFAATVIRLHGQGGGGWSANTGWGEELLAIAIAVIGGTRITGGRLDPVSLLMAAFAVYVSRDLITNDLRVPSEVASILFGVLLLIVAWSDVRKRMNGDPR